MARGSVMKLEETRISSEGVYDGRLLHVRRDKVMLPDGRQTTREFIRHQGAVAIVPLDGDGNVAVERQFRYPMGQVLAEIPAGKLDSPDEDRLEAAKRELREETGLSADRWTLLGDFFPSPAYTDEVITLYLAEGLHEGQTELDEGEFINVEWIPLKQLAEQVLDGRIPDGKTQAGVLRAAVLHGALFDVHGAFPVA